MVEPELVRDHHRRGAAAARNLRDRLRRGEWKDLARAGDYLRLGLGRRRARFDEPFSGAAFFLAFFLVLRLPPSAPPLVLWSSLSSIFSDSFSSTSSSVSSSRSSPSGSDGSTSGTAAAARS